MKAVMGRGNGCPTRCAFRSTGPAGPLALFIRRATPLARSTPGGHAAVPRACRSAGDSEAGAPCSMTVKPISVSARTSSRLPIIASLLLLGSTTSGRSVSPEHLLHSSIVTVPKIGGSALGFEALLLPIGCASRQLLPSYQAIATPCTGRSDTLALRWS